MYLRNTFSTLTQTLFNYAIHYPLGNEKNGDMYILYNRKKTGY